MAVSISKCEAEADREALLDEAIAALRAILRRSLIERVAQPIPIGRVPSFNILHRLTLLAERVIELHTSEEPGCDDREGRQRDGRLDADNPSDDRKLGAHRTDFGS